MKPPMRVKFAAAVRHPPAQPHLQSLAAHICSIAAIFDKAVKNRNKNHPRLV